jgi:hypothetical protein
MSNQAGVSLRPTTLSVISCDIADAVLDRLVHNAHRLVLKGESLRKRAAKALMLDPEAGAWTSPPFPVE